jgi:hypothetical protein
MLVVAATIILVGIIVNVPVAAQIASGQPEQPVIGRPAEPSIEVLVKPYLWLPWTSVGISPIHEYPALRKPSAPAS